MTFGDRLSGWLSARGKSLADIQRATSIDFGTLSRLRSGKRQPREYHVHAIATALGLSMGEFYGPLPTPVASADDLKSTTVE